MLTYWEAESVALREWWSTRWYAPILALAGLLFVLLVAGQAAMERLSAQVPHAVVPQVWTSALDRAETALVEGDTVAAMSAWRDAHAAAMRSGRWEGMIAVGDASRRPDASAEAEDEGIARARQAYLTALFVAQALRIAEQQAGRDPASRARVRAVADRWMKSPLEIDTRDPHLSGGHQP